MKSLKDVIPVFVIVLTAMTFACQGTNQPPEQVGQSASGKTLYYGIKINDVLCGYSQVSITPFVQDEKPFLRIEDTTFVKVSALGSHFTSEIHSVMHVDSSSGQFTYQNNHIKQHPMDFKVEIHVVNDTIFTESTLSNQIGKIAIDSDVILRNNQYFSFLMQDFSDDNTLEKTYRIYEVKDEKVYPITFRRIGDERLKLAGEKYETLVLEEMNQETGLKITWWLNKQNGDILKTVTNRREIFLADAKIRTKITTGNMDDLILLKTNESIGDVPGISYMKVKAHLEPYGLRITPENLNVQGQSFTGTVSENVVKGVFEIQHRRYQGENAPAFPADFSSVDSVQEFLQPTDIFNSDDPVLIAKAKQLTDGAQDSWEAAVSLSQWVADSIGYAVPGGLTARHTYDIRKGECGAHSILLAAFCQAVGIPARMVWGCMYIPNQGGVFGQHAWTEIYMGQAGWIPVDATAREVDFVDCGHVRLGHFQSLSISLNAKAMTILEYRVGSRSEHPLDQENNYQPYVGTYKGHDKLNILVQDGQLTMDIPGKVILTLNDPDEAGFWRAKMSNNLFLEFMQDESGVVKKVILHQLITLPRKTDVDTETFNDVPEELTPYLGIYDFQHANADFRVFYKDGSLAIHNPLENRDVKLQSPDERGRWKDEFDKNEIFFDLHPNGNVKSLIIDSINPFQKES